MMAISLPELNYDIERLATKAICAADVLESTAKIAEQLQKLEWKVNRYVRQAGLIVTWKRGSGVFTMVGSVAKTAGGALVLAAPLHPKLALAITAGHRLWKFGTGLKVLTAIGGMLRELWHNGCRETLVEYTKCAALLTQNLGVFQEIIEDLQGTTGQLNMTNNNNFQAPEEVFNALSQFIPAQQIGYATHVINIVFGNKHYSPLFDFISLSSDPLNESDLLRVMREIEGFNFTEFAQFSDSKSLVAIGSFLHVSRELLDFLDGFKKVTDKDCRFIHNCLTRFTEESHSIMKVVSLLSSLSKIKQKLQSTKTIKAEEVESAIGAHLLDASQQNNGNEEKHDIGTREKTSLAICERNKGVTSAEEEQIDSSAQNQSGDSKCHNGTVVAWNPPGIKVVSLLSSGLFRMKQKLQSAKTNKAEEATSIIGAHLLDASKQINVRNMNEENLDITSVEETSSAICDRNVVVTLEADENNSHVQHQPSDSDCLNDTVVAWNPSASHGRYKYRAEVVAKSKDFIFNTFSTMTLALEQGSTLIASTVKMRRSSKKHQPPGVESSQFAEGQESLSQI